MYAMIMATFTINISQMLAYIPYMDPMGLDMWLQFSGIFTVCSGISLLGLPRFPDSVRNDFFSAQKLARQVPEGNEHMSH